MQVIDSSTWTGLSSDPFADLTSSEREGELRYEPRRWRLVVLLVPSTLIVAAASAQLIRYGRQFHPITDLASVLNNYTVFGGLAIGLAMLLIGLVVCRSLVVRAKKISLTAPLIIGSKSLIAGSKQRRVLFENVTDMKPERASYVKGSLIKHMHDQPQWTFRGSRTVPVVKILVKNGEQPLVLDLATLSGQPERIATILAYRIEKAQSNTSKNV